MIRKIIAAFICFWVFVPSSFAQGEKIDFFKSNMLVEHDGTIKVTETITYDFGSLNKHGIFRRIPVTMTNDQGKKYSTPVTINSVTDENGRPYKYTETTSDGFKEVKIGDANVLVTGVNVYMISYDIEGTIREFSDHDEVYFNVTGNGWDVPINIVNAIVSFGDQQQAPTGLRAACYTGIEGSAESSCNYNIRGFNNYYVSSRNLAAGEGMTIVLGLDKGYLAPVPAKPVEKVELQSVEIL